MIADVCGQTGVKKEQIYEVSVGANCTMMHMLLGVDATVHWKITVCTNVCKGKGY